MCCDQNPSRKHLFFKIQKMTKRARFEVLRKKQKTCSVYEVRVGNVLSDNGFYSTTSRTTVSNSNVRPPRAAETHQMAADNNDGLGYVFAVAI